MRLSVDEQERIINRRHRKRTHLSRSPGSDAITHSWKNLSTHYWWSVHIWYNETDALLNIDSCLLCWPHKVVESRDSDDCRGTRILFWPPWIKNTLPVIDYPSSIEAYPFYTTPQLHSRPLTTSLQICKCRLKTLSLWSHSLPFPMRRLIPSCIHSMSHCDSFISTLELDRKMFDHKLTMAYIAGRIAESFKTDPFVMWSDDNSEKLIISCRVLSPPT